MKAKQAIKQLVEMDAWGRTHKNVPRNPMNALHRNHQEQRQPDRLETWALSMANDVEEQIQMEEISADEGEVYDYLKTNYRADNATFDQGAALAIRLLRNKGVIR